MTRFFTIGLVLLSIFTAMAQNEEEEVMLDEEGEEMLVGPGQLNDLRVMPYKAWFKAEYDAFKPDVSPLVPYKEDMMSAQIIVVMGTWCEDSRREVPRLVKIFHSLHLFLEPKIIFVDEEKDDPAGQAKALGVKYVPTIIFRNKKGEEMGRIVESPDVDLVSDILKIFSK